jgi:hypothetical protein
MEKIFILSFVIFGFFSVASSGNAATLLTETWNDQSLPAAYDQLWTSAAFDSSIRMGSTGYSAKFTWNQGATIATGTGPAAARYLIPATEQIYVSTYWRFNSDWVGSGQGYHPHLIYILSDTDYNVNGAYSGLAANYLDTYIEPHALGAYLVLQDILNEGTTYGAVCGSGCFYAPSVDFVPNQWYRIEVWLKMNTMNGNSPNADGEMKMWVDGVSVYDANNRIYRNGQNPTMKWRTVNIGPWIGDGSPRTQTMWMDDLIVGTERSTGGSCGDGSCLSGETCTSCPQDCPTGSGQVCCSGSVFTGNCCTNSDCPSGQSCSNHACSGTSCTCTSWVNGACGGSCPSQRQQARTCTPSGCDTTSRCIADAACGSSTGELVLHLNLNEGSGTSASDSSGKGNTATITGATWTTDSKSGGQALSLGSSGYIRVPASSSMGFDKSQGTIGMWIKPTSPISDSYQLLAMDSSYGIELNIQPEGNLFFYPWVDPSWNDYNLVTNPLSAGQWQHLAVTWDYSTKAVKLYVNGAEKTPSVQNVPTYWTAIASTADWHIGGSPVKDQYLAGLIDEIKVYSKALTPAEILQDYSGSTCIHKSDTDCSGCVEPDELTAFISRWFTSNQDVTMRELMEAIGLWKKGC